MKLLPRSNVVPEPSKVHTIAKQLNITETTAKVLIARGIDSLEAASAFIHPTLNGIHDPFLFKDMDKACAKIKDVAHRNGLIAIYGDYDVDGTTAASILALELSSRRANVKVYIPNRAKEGYGLNAEAVRFLASQGVNLIITVDCGITSVAEIALAYQLGMEVIVTDHHEPGDVLPSCVCVIDAKIPNQTYPYRELCGAGVAGKLVQALSGPNAIFKYVDMIAFATVADVVPLTGENRILTMLGLKMLNQDKKRPCYKALIDVAGINQDINSYYIGYRLAPMINACGRLDDANAVIGFYTSPNYNDVTELATMFNSLNEKRKKVEADIYKLAIQQLSSEYKTILPKALIVSGSGWDVGVIGIVASRLCEKFNRPSIVLSNNGDGTYTGSCRSISGINIHSVLSRCDDLLIRFGGHEAAAGMSVSADNLQFFKSRILTVMEEFDIDLFVPSRKYDAKVAPYNISEKLVEELKLFEPCGVGNPKPYFMVEDGTLKGLTVLGANGEHYKGSLSDSKGSVPCIAFNKQRPETTEHLNVLVTPSLNEYNGRVSVQAIIEAVVETAEYAKDNSLKDSTIYGHIVKDEPLGVLDISAEKIKQFNKANIFTVHDLITYVPRKYMDFRYPKTVRTVNEVEVCSMIGSVVKIYANDPRYVKAVCVDDNGDRFNVLWFNQNFVAKELAINTRFIFCGTAKKQPPYNPSGQTSLMYEVTITPTFFSRDIFKYKTLVPIYKKIPGMSNDYLTASIRKAFDSTANTDYLEKDFVDEFGLVPEKVAHLKFHMPRNEEDIEQAKKRQIFDQLFKFNFRLKEKSKDTLSDSAYKMRSQMIFDLLKPTLPYQLTEDQLKAITGMADYMKEGPRMSALLQGDVGSGKTIVAFFLMCLAHENGYQACLIAPTEVLARQHYEDLSELTRDLGIKVGFLVGGMKAAERNAVLKGLKSGEISLVVGTHAVLQDSVVFKSLAVAIIDEQHRFGVDQREKFMNLENRPHLITMSATPIPRTLGMALFGDNIQVFNIKTKPNGRKPVITKKVSLQDAYQKMLGEIRAGHQCYVICPLIEDSKSEVTADVQSVKAEVEALQSIFKDYPEVKIECITGKMKKDEIAAGLDRFASGEANVLVSTTIVEVGVNVPNATVMVIKSSERFGLAQAHQLRGRVGRSSIQSYCLLCTDKDDIKADILCSTTDGFEIASEDMKLRGLGDFIGTQQTGNNSDVMLMIAEPDMYKHISELNDRIFEDRKLYEKYRYLLEDNNG